MHETPKQEARQKKKKNCYKTASKTDAEQRNNAAKALSVQTAIKKKKKKQAGRKIKINTYLSALQQIPAATHR